MWEYKITTRLSIERPITERELNDLGEQLWELVAIDSRKGETKYIFKRTKH